jgi:hypothetical protein
LPDVVASVILRGRIPKIIDAFRIEPSSELLEDLKATKLGGKIEINPTKQDFFKVVITSEERIPERVDDPRFRGVYLMLASLLPLEQAAELRETLVDRAAETKDHYLSDAVVQILKGRRAKPEVVEVQITDF